MNIINATIENVAVGLDEQKRLNVMIEIEHAISPPIRTTHNFPLIDPRNVEFVARLMEYAGEEVVTKLNGKIIRIITTPNGTTPVAWGHLTEDKFLTRTIGETIKQVSQQTIEWLFS